MKTKKWIGAVVIICLALLMFSSGVFAIVDDRVVNAPLDGGLITVLGAAGIAYFIIRKKKK